MSDRTSNLLNTLRCGTSAFALGLAVTLAAVSVGAVASPTYADSHSGSNAGNGDGKAGSGNQGAGGGNSNAGGGNHDSGDDHDDDADHGNSGNQGQGGSGNAGAGGQGGASGPKEDSDSEGRGPEYGKPDDGDSKGGKPIWAQEGIPEVELGRLNVARSPEHVLDQAYDEALATLNPAMASYYDMTLDQAITALSLDFDNVSMIDSPLQNLALLKDALDGTSVLNSYPGVSNEVDVLAAMLLGAASDKTVTITPDTALAVAAILGFDLTDAQATALAADAEAIRIAILAGHG